MPGRTRPRNGRAAEDGGVTIRVMRPADIPRGLELCRASGWNQVAADWRELLALGGSGCLVAELDGRVVGTATAVVYEGRFAWIGMVLVDPDARGRGIGTALMEHALGALGDLPARLDATPKGYPLYCRLGFVEEARFCRMTRSAGTTSAAGFDRPRGLTAARPMRPQDLDAVAAWDCSVFGADRRALLTWAFGAAPALAWVAEDEAGIQGYCFGRCGHTWSQVGPVVSRDVATGADLVAACASASERTPLVVDAASAASGWMRGLTAIGFVEQRRFIRMCRGTNAHGGEREPMLAIFGPEWG